MLQKQVASKRGGSKAPPPMANLSLVLQRPLVRPSQAEKKGGKVKARQGLATTSRHPPVRTSKQSLTRSSRHPPVTSKLNLTKRSMSNVSQKPPAALTIMAGNCRAKKTAFFSKTETDETLGEDLELALRTRLALRKTPMTISETQLLQMDRKTDWALWEESCLTDWN